MILPLTSRTALARGWQVHNIASLKNKFFRYLFIKTYPLGLFIQKERLYATPALRHLVEFVQNKINVLDYLTVAGYVGSPGRNQKLTFQFSNSRGEIVGYLKIAQNKESKDFLENEYDIINHLHKHVQEICLPENVFLEAWQECLLLFQKPVTSQLYPISLKLDTTIVRSLIELGNQQWVHGNWEENLQKIKDDFFEYGQHIISTRWKESIQKMVARLQKRRYSPCLVHGDFVLYNIKRCNRQLYIYDWEFAEKDGLPFQDLFHFLYQGYYQIKRTNVKTIIRRNILNHQKNQTFFNHYAQSLSIQKADIMKLFLIYLMKSFNFDIRNRPVQDIEENHFFQGIRFLVDEVL